MKTDWSHIPVRELVSYYIGGGWGKEEADDVHTEPAFVIRGTDIPDAEFGDVSGVPHRYHKASNLASRRLQPNDIVFEVSGGSKAQPVGRALLVTESTLGSLDGAVMCASFCKLVRADPDKVVPRFFLDYLRMIYRDGRIMEYQTQSTGISNFKFEDFLDRHRVQLPPIQIQRVISGVLTAYDELIENNLQRIEILEKMSHAIYREWFVEFRFPGHEELERVQSSVGSVPEGWDVSPFADLASFVNGYAFKSKIHWQKTGKPIVKIKELKNGISPDTPRYHGEDIDPKYHIDAGALLFSWSADLDAYIWAHGPALLNQHLFHVVPRDGIESDFLFHALKERMPEFRGRAQGTTMKHIKRSALSEVSTAVPPTEIRGRFAEVVGPMHELVQVLTTMIANLRTTRDLLLPKLIAGEIDVSDLDIDTAWLAA